MKVLGVSGSPRKDKSTDRLEEARAIGFSCSFLAAHRLP